MRPPWTDSQTPRKSWHPSHRTSRLSARTPLRPSVSEELGGYVRQITLDIADRLNAIKEELTVIDTIPESSIPQTSGRGASPANGIRSRSVASFVCVLAILVASAMTVSCGQIGIGNEDGPAGDSAAGESSPSDEQPLTVEEYAQRCTGKQISDFDTVYDLVDALKERLEIGRGIKPPPELREFHDATIKRQEAMITASRRLPGSQRPHEYMFLPEQASELYRADDERNFILFDLDPEVRKTLQLHGCID